VRHTIPQSQYCNNRLGQWQNHAELLFNVDIPAYLPQQNLYLSQSDTIHILCDIFQTTKEQKSQDAFAQQVKSYLDLNFTDENLCSTTLEEHFQCSYVKIRKSFSKDIGIPISTYIESKRMDLANELLLRGEYSVMLHRPLSRIKFLILIVSWGYATSRSACVSVTGFAASQIKPCQLDFASLHLTRRLRPMRKQKKSPAEREPCQLDSASFHLARGLRPMRKQKEPRFCAS